MMLKKFAAIGVSAAIAFAPLAALAQTDTTAPAAAPAASSDTMAKKPMHKKPMHKKHMSKKMDKSMEPAPAEAPKS